MQDYFFSFSEYLPDIWQAQNRNTISTIMNPIIININIYISPLELICYILIICFFITFLCNKKNDSEYYTIFLLYFNFFCIIVYIINPIINPSISINTSLNCPVLPFIKVW